MTKQAQIIGDVRQKIANGVYAPGRPLPTQKMLSSHYGVAMGTVRQALASLARDGILESRRGFGTIVNPNIDTGNAPDTPARRLGLLVPESWFGGTYVTTLKRILAENPEFDLSIRFADSQTKESILDWAQPLAAVLTQDAISIDLMEYLRATGKPVMVIGYLLTGRCPSWASEVITDADMAYHMAVQFVHSLGHRRILLVRESGSFYFESVGRAFQHEVKKLGGDVIGDQVIAAQGDDGSTLLEHLDGCKQKPTAVIVDGGLQCCRHLHALQSAGWRVPDQISLLSMNQVPEDWLSTPTLSRVEMSIGHWAGHLAEALRSVIDDGAIVREHLPPRIVWGKTCGRVEDGTDH
ncbi:substrate-binding domain-containing protein [Phycisphaerales bacterium AB-hyl4]|uniref:Substrate-binding domain-containing protein n=1 Tax=Natronomicrosphaera hydrolytica TaxID=3242702 RepID=A0ABV4U3B5_9BACT